MKLLCTTLVVVVAVVAVIVVVVVVVVVVARVSRRLLFCQLDSHKNVEQRRTYPVLPGLSVVGLPSGIVPTLAGVRPIRIRRIRRTTRLLVGSLTASTSSSPSVPTRGLEEVSFVPRIAGQGSDRYILVAINATLEAS
jgi:uncharacterized membrane protein